jgi:hypothetical protein
LKLGDDTRYTPDYQIIENDGTIVLAEVKGPFIRQVGRVKYECAKTQFPEFEFHWVTFDGTQWKTE